MIEYPGKRIKTAESSTKRAADAAIADYLRRVTRAYGDELVSVFLFGSRARGDAGPASDIDLLVLVRSDSPALREALANVAWDVQFEHDLLISDVVRSLDQWRQMQAAQFPFYQNLERGGILLWTNASEPIM
jgi:predicted nucleotidyltransferase